MTDTIPDESPSSIPPNLSSSIILSTLPRDATTALTEASAPSKVKLTVRFKAVGRAPILVEAKQRGQIGSDQKFGTLANHLRKQLKLKASESLFLYVNSSFAPGLDETVGNLYQCFNTQGELIVNYCTTPAFG